LADTMLTIKDEDNKAVFPTGGTRVLAYPAMHHAVADGGVAGQAAGGSGDYAFVYLNLRVGRGRSEATLQRAGQKLTDVVHAHLADVFAKRHIGITFQVDVGTEVFDNKHSNLHPLFNKS
jgi:5-carboxymethyl-2-hydroxymuconate isomerase